MYICTRSTEVAVAMSSVVMILSPSALLLVPPLFLLVVDSEEREGELDGAFSGSIPNSLSGPHTAADRALRVHDTQRERDRGSV